MKSTESKGTLMFPVCVLKSIDELNLGKLLYAKFLVSESLKSRENLTFLVYVSKSIDEMNICKLF